MLKDSELLREFTEQGSTKAFETLVHRHIDLVYSIAYRQLNQDEHRAKDVCQEVFTTLSKKASKLSASVVLAGWLYSTTRNVARTTIRTEQRRQQREQEASTMENLNKNNEAHQTPVKN